MSRPEASKILENVARVLIGKEQVTEYIVTALLAGGHVLLEDVPGTGKTVMARSLAASIDGRFSRIQFTPDLLPSDVTGLNYFNQKEAAFVFRPGPVFCEILLADEINRATPRTQSALLECMEERQVTIDGETRPVGRPFFVIATQNPIETAGTFPLPEAQMDRFLMRLSMGLPSEDEEVAIMDRFINDDPLSALSSVMTSEDLAGLQQAVREVYVHPLLRRYIAQIVQATREHRLVLTGVSPRGTLAFLRAAQAHALLLGRDYVVPEDIKPLAESVLAHRLVLAGGGMANRRAKEVIEEVTGATAVPTEDFSGGRRGMEE